MGYKRKVVLIITFAIAARSEAQFYPELSFPLSAEANAMGGAGAALVSENPFAATLNPAQVGLSGLRGTMSIGIVPGFSLPRPYVGSGFYDLWYVTSMTRAAAMSFGFPLNRFWKGLPFQAAFGIGYANLRYTLVDVGESSPPRADYLNAITTGLGLKYLVTFGIGYSIDPMSSAYQSFPSADSHTTSHDIGTILRIPILRIVSRIGNNRRYKFGKLMPEINLSLGYSARNLGTHSYYSEAGMPEQADLGWNVELGLKACVQHQEWKWISLTFLREADASLIYTSLDSIFGTNPYTNTPDTSYYTYYARRKGLGGFQIYRNLIAGRPTAFDDYASTRPAGGIGVLKGAQIELGQFIYIREGSVTEAGLPTYTTYGWGARLDGLVKALLFMHWLSAKDKIAELLLDHFNLEFDFSKGTGGPFENEAFETLGLVVR